LRFERPYKGDELTARLSRGGSVSDEISWYVGVDWGSEGHALCLMDATGAVRGTRQVAHAAEAVHAAVTWIVGVTGATPGQIAIAIETPRGVLVDTFVEAGFAVSAINPKQLDRFRDRFTAAGAKDDTRDAHVLADARRTDPQAFRAVHPDDPLIIQVREISRLIEDLQVDERRWTNRLREQLYRVDAAWLAFSPAADDPWLWEVLAQRPDPASWATLARRQLTPVLRAHRIRRVTAETLVTALRRPRFAVAAGVSDAVAVRVATLVAQLRVVHRERLEATRRLDRLLARLAAPEAPESESPEHRDAAILLSLPGVGRMVTATMLAEATGPLAARDYPTLRAHAGAAPVTKRSGKRLHRVQMRYACNRRLRQALYHWARVSIQQDDAARTYYEQLRSRGLGFARALRSVADRWLRILVAMLTSRTLYDPTRFTAA
jgi:transposase